MGYFNEKEVKMIRDIIQEVIEETKKNRAVGSTETARIILSEINKFRKSEGLIDGITTVLNGYQPKSESFSNPPCGGSSVKKLKQN